jgi:hypothetical protein
MYKIPCAFKPDGKVRYGVSIDVCHPQYDDHISQSLVVIFGILDKDGARSVPGIELECTEIPSVVAAFRKAADLLEQQYEAAKKPAAKKPAANKPGSGDPAPAPKPGS